MQAVLTAGRRDYLRFLVLVALLAPIAIAYRRLAPAWDELYFLHRAACVNRAVFGGSLVQLDQCLAGMAKSPVMALMLLPAGPLQGTLDKLAVAPLALALFCFSQILLLAWLTARARIPALMTVLAAVTACLAGPLWARAPFLVDGLFTLCVVNTALLAVLEQVAPATDTAAAVRRGLLWAAVATLGLLAKLTYFYFAALCFLPVLVLSLRHSGLRPTLLKLAAALVLAILPAALFLRYGAAYFHHGLGAAFGPLSAFYDDGLGRWTFLAQAARSLGPGYGVGLAALAIWAALTLRGTSRWERPLLALWLLAVFLGYLFLASGSPNKDARFFWPVWLALPFCLAAAAPPERERTAAGLAGPMLLGAGLALALALPMTARLDLRHVALAERALEELPGDQPIRVLIASDETYFNIETLLLAREVGWPRLHRIALETVVYDIVQNRTVEQSIERLLQADFVVLRSPVGAAEPEWTNRFLPRFQAALEQQARLVESRPGSPQMLVFGRR